MTYPRLTWSRGVVASAVLHRTKADMVLVGEVTDFGLDGPDRWRADWLGGGVIDRAAFSSSDEARAWVRELVVSRMGAAL